MIDWARVKGDFMLIAYPFVITHSGCMLGVQLNDQWVVYAVIIIVETGVYLEFI